MEIRNKLTVTRREERGSNREKEGEGSRNMYRGPMCTDNGVEIDCGREVRAGESNEEKCGTTVIEE